MERRDVFDTIAAQYDSIRPGYPAELIEREYATVLWLSRRA